MKQQTLAMANGFERYTKKTRRTLFLEEMEQVVPWAELCGLIEPVYAKVGNGRPPVGAERMLRIYFLQQWFNLSDPDRASGAVGRVVWADRAGVCQGGQRSASGGSGADAADLLFAAVVQPIRPGSGRSAVRFCGDAAVCGHRSGAGAGAG